MIRVFIAGALLAALGSTFSAANAGTSSAFSVTKVEGPHVVHRLCPVVVPFTATIQAPTSAYGVQYRWERSDGATSAPMTAGPTTAGVLTVTDSWTLDKSFTGWESVHLLGSTGGAFAVTQAQPRASFHVACVGK